MFKTILCICLCVISLQAFSKELLIGINQRDIYRFKDEQGKWQGKDIDLIQATFANLPHSYKLVEMPWARILKSLESGVIDMTVSAAITDERSKYALFSSHPYRYNHHMLFGTKEKLAELRTVTHLADIINKDIILGVLRGAVYSDVYNELLNNPAFTSHLIYLDNEQNMADIALKGRVDAYVEAEIEGFYYLSKNPQYREKIFPIVRITEGEQSAGYLMFSRKTADASLVSEFDQALSTMHKSGEYESISNKYKKQDSAAK